MKTLLKITTFLMMILTSFSLQAQYNAGTGSGTNGSNRTFVGFYAGRVNTGANNSFFGRNAGYENTSGYSNTFAGSTAGRFNTTGIENSFFGRGSGYRNTTGKSNVFLGTYAGYDNTTASYNTFVGERTGRFNTTAQYGTFLGRRAGYNNTTGEYNAFVGANTGYANTAGNRNTFTGYAAGRFNTTGSNNTFLGYQAGYDVVTGEDNTILGYRAGYNSTGTRNVFVGFQAGYNETGDNKLYIDNSSTANPLIEGDFSDDILTFNGQVGVNGDVPVIPNDKIELYVDGRFSQRQSGNFGGFGSSDRWSSLGNSPVSSIYGMLNQGYGATFISGSKSGANNIIGFSGNRLDFDVIGASGPTTTRVSILNNGRVGIGFTNPQYEMDINGSIRVIGSYFGSDKRYKENIKGIENAMDKINALDGVTYDFKAGEINGYNFKAITDKKQIGFIAQDVEKVFPELVDTDENDYLSVNYVALIPVLVEAMKEQEDVIDEQEILIDEQQQEMLQQQEQITDLQSRMERLEALLTDSENIQGSSLPFNENINIAGVMLRQNAPNPFSDRTTIQYELPDNLGVASLVVYDLNSRQIATYSIAGKGSIEFNASGLPNGTYGYSILANGKRIASQKMIIQR